MNKESKYNVVLGGLYSLII